MHLEEVEKTSGQDVAKTDYQCHTQKVDKKPCLDGVKIDHQCRRVEGALTRQKWNRPTYNLETNIRIETVHAVDNPFEFFGPQEINPALDIGLDRYENSRLEKCQETIGRCEVGKG